ncbi:unnamed protein product [Moneuplotes crassus]|uniref:Uncharacterized protein n=1 Tax=Euplotes crassus TaxID=5936 RepID=A0AAD1XD32_EUPCR|nr:unnamed protein product [Moneuplotes crassus]
MKSQKAAGGVSKCWSLTHENSIKNNEEWKDNFFCFRKNKLFNDDSPDGSYFTAKSNNCHVSSSTDLMNRAKGIKSFLSLMDKCRSTQKNRRNGIQITIPKEEKLMALLKKGKSSKKKRDITKPIKFSVLDSQTPLEQTNTKDSISKPRLTYEQMNIIQAATKNNFTYLRRVRDKRDRRDFNVHDKKGNCALYYAIKEDCYEAAEYLINKIGVNVNSINENGNTCLHQAMMRDNIDMIMLLLRNGANPEIFNKFNETPIFYASNRILSRFRLRNKKACLLKNFEEFQSKEKFMENRRIRINLHPKRNDKQKRLHLQQMERQRSEELRDFHNYQDKKSSCEKLKDVQSSFQISAADIRGINLKFTPKNNKRQSCKKNRRTKGKKKLGKNSFSKLSASKSARRVRECMIKSNNGGAQSALQNKRYLNKDSSPLYPHNIYFDL